MKCSLLLDSRCRVLGLSLFGLSLFGLSLTHGLAGFAGAQETRSVVRERTTTGPVRSAPSTSSATRVPGGASSGRSTTTSTRTTRSQEPPPTTSPGRDAPPVGRDTPSIGREPPPMNGPSRVEELPPGMVEGPAIVEGGPDEYYEEYDEHGHPLHQDPSCSTCGGMGCPSCWLGGRGLLDGLYVRAEFLRWRTSGMVVPPLVTSSVATAGTTFPPPVTQAGVLGQPGTVILYGNESLFNDERSGGRLTAGLPLDREYRLTLEGEYFSLDEATDSFSASSSGNPILARPFFNMLTSPSNIPAQSSELVAYPNVIRGTVTVDAESTFQGAAVRGRYLLCCTEACVPGLLQRNYQVPGGYRMELTAGYRFLRLDDNLVIGEDLATIPAPGGFVLQDSFKTQNEFHGIEVGMLLQTRRGRWTMDVLSRVAVGNSAGTVTINGTTVIDNGTTSVTHQGALLAQTSNIGTYNQDVLAVAPELGLTIGFDLTPRWRALVGYTFIYWSQVLRAGQQIDLDVNPNLIPPAVSPLVGPQRPGFTPVYSDFWAQGLTIGIEGQW